MLICVATVLTTARCGWECQIECRPCPPAPVSGVANLGTPPKPMSSFELSIESRTCFLRIDSSVAITAPRTSTYASHHRHQRQPLHARKPSHPSSQPVGNTKASPQASKTWPPHLFPHHIYYCREEAAYHALLTSADSEAAESLPAKSISRLESLDSRRGWHFC
jgi:hypothetical protein